MLCLEFLKEDEVTLSKRTVKEGLNFDCAFPTVIWRQMRATGLPPSIGFCSFPLGPTEQSSVSQWQPTISFRLRKGQVLCCLSKHSPHPWAGAQELNAMSGKTLQLPQILEYLVFVSFPPAILEVQIHPSGRIHLPTLLYLQPCFLREGHSWRKLPVDNIKLLYCQHYAIIFDRHSHFVGHTVFLFHLTQMRSQHHPYTAVIVNWAISRHGGMDKWGHSKVKPSSVSCKWPLFCFVLSGLKEEVNLPIRIAWKHVLIGQLDEYV